MATIPTVPVEPAGVISTSADNNAWANAAKFLLGSAAGTNPVFFLMSGSAQTWTTSQSAVNFSNGAAVFKDNDGGFNSGTPGRYTIQTAGFWTVDWTVNGGTTASNLQAFCQVVTTASNPFNPSATIKFQFCNEAQTTGTAFVNAGGLVPIYLFPADQLSIQVITGASSTSGTTPLSHMTGQLVSA